jgi:hypothetical protein
MIQVHSRLQTELDKEIPLVEMFSHPTVSLLTGYLTEDNGTDEPLPETTDRADNRRNAQSARLSHRLLRQVARLQHAGARRAHG